MFSVAGFAGTPTATGAPQDAQNRAPSVNDVPHFEQKAMFIL
jgi:hypothetical protein